ncbi:MAG TPA: subclass B1 metallo-beta-lactamase [Bacteroidia bacterium]
MRYLFILSTFLLVNHFFAQETKKQLEITRLSKDAYAFTTYNEYKGYRVPANGMYTVTCIGVVMIDTPWDTTQFQPLLDSIEKRHNKKVVLCISTHHHNDRTGGLEYYRSKGIKTFTSLQTLELCRQKGEKQPEFYFTQDTAFTLCDMSFVTYYPGQGHAQDNIVVYAYKHGAYSSGILYGGCFVKSTESTDLGNLNDANVAAWETSVKKVQTKFGKSKTVIPGHFGWKGNSLKHTQKLIEKYLKGGK